MLSYKEKKIKYKDSEEEIKLNLSCYSHILISHAEECN